MGFCIFWCVLPAFIALVVHGYFTKGPRITFNFYFFAALYVARWALRKRTLPTVHIPSGADVSGSHVSWGPPDLPGAFFSLSIIVLCVCLLYLCWIIAERILKRLGSDRIFWAVTFCGLLAASFSYFIEVAGVGFGWWGLRLVYDNSLGRFFSGCPYPVLISWFYFAVYFFSAFFLIELSRLRDKPWKCVFILFAFIHSSVIEIFGAGMPAVIEHLAVLAVLVQFIVYSKLPFDRYHHRPKQCNTAIKKIPETLMCVLIIFMYLIFTVVLKKPFMLFSLLPILVFFLFSINKKLLFLTVPVVVMAALIDRGAGMPAITAVAIVFIFIGLQRISNRAAGDAVCKHQ